MNSDTDFDIARTAQISPGEATSAWTTGALKVEQKHATLLGLSMLTDRLGGQIYQFLEQNS